MLIMKLKQKMDTAYQPCRIVFIICTIFVGFTIITWLGLFLGQSVLYASETIIALCALAVMLLLRQNELMVVSILAIHLYVDWYLGLGGIALLLACMLLINNYMRRSPAYLWQEPRHLWLWGLFLLLSLFSALHGISLADALYYYFNIVVGAFLMLWLGIVIVRTPQNLKYALGFLSAFGALVAIHAIIQATTGQTLFASTRFERYFTTISNYVIADTFHRSGSFLINPDSSGSFFSMMLLLPLGLFCASASILGKLFYAVQVALITIALSFSYSTGGWAAAGAGLFVFIMLVKQTRYRLQIIMLSILIGIMILNFFPQQFSIQLQHAIAPNELSLRQGAWLTGIQVITAFPLTGVGLGRYAYIMRAEPYRVIEQYRPLAHPHNSYLELAALAGLPVMVIFAVLLIISFYAALQNWRPTEGKKCLWISSGIAALVALSMNSFVASGWTLAPLAAIGWLILGLISSPLLKGRQLHEAEKELSGEAQS
ncbi:hypothetical protein KDH_28100 [Dictyobacter sp. S3.2.2.5]|uniref:O-antigen ligase-related domain-containing protein n=1 Tax=Dictyobacter halimunensis TaxID=3026934 RepID=A0ABQ6FNX3_9CHLR|nr:hypothetical protein KDH_28100 [Dictyobacter sp. S3.2.2.5]